MHLNEFQAEVGEWARRNFGSTDPACETRVHRTFLGIVEEVGELSHALLKAAQGIRGTPAEHEAAAQDAFVDILVYMMDFADRKGWNTEALVKDIWGKVKQRDWKKFPKNGLSE